MFALIARVKNLLLSPRTEWDAIDREETTPQKLAGQYVAPLAVIPTVAFVIGLTVLGVQGERAEPVSLIASAVLFYVLTLAGVFVFAWLIDWLAPRFGAQRNYRQAFKVSAYSLTPAMVAGIVTVIPALGVFALLGAVYSLYLLFIGAPIVMHAMGKSAVGSSRVDLQACKLEYSIVSPK